MDGITEAILESEGLLDHAGPYEQWVSNLPAPPIKNKAEYDCGIMVRENRFVILLDHARKMAYYENAHSTLDRAYLSPPNKGDYFYPDSKNLYKQSRYFGLDKKIDIYGRLIIDVVGIEVELPPAPYRTWHPAHLQNQGSCENLSKPDNYVSMPMIRWHYPSGTWRRFYSSQHECCKVAHEDGYVFRSHTEFDYKGPFSYNDT